ncbi:MAG TPA: DMT family transporter [Vicinamibacterales bacterium]|jgi:drug/metabolite transporter (DMT)-like permease|nr:DMT family transporter [Vicinamibacterales bacterium]
MTAHSRAWLQIHVCVVLWGFTAILGRLITLRALPLVWWRMLLVTLALALWPRFWAGLRHLSGRLIAIYIGIGVLVTLHWITFYGAIKLSNASVAATCMALTPVFVSFIEPWLARRRPHLAEVGMSVAVLPGVALVVGGTPAGMRNGILVGAFSALVAGVFSTLNKRTIGTSPALTVTGLQMGAGALVLPAVAWLLPGGEPIVVRPDLHDGLLLLALSMACTLFPYALALVALRHLSAFDTTLAVNMEPVYAIVLAILLLNEQRDLEPSFYAGVALIMAIVFSHPWVSRRWGRKRYVEAGL